MERINDRQNASTPWLTVKIKDSNCDRGTIVVGNSSSYFLNLNAYAEYLVDLKNLAITILRKILVLLWLSHLLH
jgi:hypothetical protein